MLIFLKCDFFGSIEFKDENGAIQLQEQLPKFPILAWYYRNITKAGCTEYPKMQDLHYNNKYWQAFEARNNGYYYLYGAFMDTRPLNSKECHQN